MRRGDIRPMPALLMLALLLPVALIVALVATSLRAGSGTAEPVRASVAGGRVLLDTEPATFGSNRFMVTVRTAQGRAVDNATVQLATTMLDMPMGTQVLTAQPVGGGRYQAVGLLSMPGRWQVSVTARSRALAGGRSVEAFQLQAADRTRPMPALLPVAGHPVPRATASPAPAAVRWPPLPYRAAVSFLGSGKVYLPGEAGLLSTGTVNHSITRVPGRDEAWVTDYGGNKVTAVDLGSGRVVAQIPVGLGPVHVAFSADGQRAWVTDLQSSDVTVVDVPTRRVLATVQVGLHPHGLAVSPDGRQVWVACGGNGGMWVLDSRTNTVVKAVPAGLLPHGVAFSPDGRTVYMTDAGPGDLVVVDRASGKVLARVPVRTGSAMAAVARDGSRIYVTGQGGSVVTVIDAQKREVLARIPVGAAPHGLVLTPDGRLLYVAVNGPDRVAVIDTSSNRVVAEITVPGAADELVLDR